MHTFQILTCFIVLFQNIIFINIISNLIKRLFKYWEAVKLKVVCLSNFKFFLKNSNFITSNKYCQLISLNDLSHLWEMSAKYEKPVCLSVLSNKKRLFHEQKVPFSSTQLHSAFLQNNHKILQCNKGVLYVLPILSNRIFLMCTQRLRFFKILIFYFPLEIFKNIFSCFVMYILKWNW